MVVCDLPRAHGPVCWCVVAEMEKRAGCRGSPYNSPASATTEDGCGRGPALSLCPIRPTFRPAWPPHCSPRAYLHCTLSTTIPIPPLQFSKRKTVCRGLGLEGCVYERAQATTKHDFKHEIPPRTCPCVCLQDGSRRWTDWVLWLLRHACMTLKRRSRDNIDSINLLVNN